MLAKVTILFYVVVLCGFLASFGAGYVDGH